MFKWMGEAKGGRGGEALKTNVADSSKSTLQSDCKNSPLHGGVTCSTSPQKHS